MNNVLNKLLLWVSLAIIAWGLTQGTHKASYVLSAIGFIIAVLYLQFKSFNLKVDPAIMDREFN